MIPRRLRYFSGGVVIGSNDFVSSFLLIGIFIASGLLMPGRKKPLSGRTKERFENGSYETGWLKPVSSMSFRGRGLEGGC